MNILTANVSETVTDSAHNAIASICEVAYGVSNWQICRCMECLDVFYEA